MVTGMDSGLPQLSACQLQLLAINALFEQARSLSADVDSLHALQGTLSLARRLEAAPQNVALQELDDAHARVLYHALMA